MRSIRPNPWLVAVVPVIFACSASASRDLAGGTYARDTAAAVQMGERCAEELSAIARASPESASRALDADVPRRASKDAVRARALAEVERRWMALLQAGVSAPREPSRAAAVAAGAHRMAGALCQARDVGFSLARVSRPAHPPRTAAFTADRRDPGAGPP